jgi:ATP/maltotriose-dependent transcriptional regulator MalT
VFRSEVVESIRHTPSFSSATYDGHLCFAEFCLCDSGGHKHLSDAARELLEIAEDAACTAGCALATLLLGEVELFSGQLESAEPLLRRADRMHEEVNAVAGRVISLERRAEVALARGQKYRAGRLVRQGFRLADSSWLKPHLLIRLQALAVETVATKVQVMDAIRLGDRWLAEGRMCQACSMAFRLSSASALVEAGELQQVARRLDETERLAGMWNGGPWVAAVWEVRAAYRQAQGRAEQATALFQEAAARYAESGRPRDQERCLTRAIEA